jgi:hypothetical protein
MIGKFIKTIILLLLTFIFSTFTCLSQKKVANVKDFPILKGPYLGQKLPGMEP